VYVYIDAVVAACASGQGYENTAGKSAWQPATAENIHTAAGTAP